jgi:hypothetical protein
MENASGRRSKALGLISSSEMEFAAINMTPERLIFLREMILVFYCTEMKKKHAASLVITGDI